MTGKDRVLPSISDRKEQFVPKPQALCFERIESRPLYLPVLFSFSPWKDRWVQGTLFSFISHWRIMVSLNACASLPLSFNMASLHTSRRTDDLVSHSTHAFSTSLLHFILDVKACLFRHGTSEFFASQPKAQIALDIYCLKWLWSRSFKVNPLFCRSREARWLGQGHFTNVRRKRTQELCRTLWITCSVCYNTSLCTFYFFPSTARPPLFSWTLCIFRFLALPFLSFPSKACQIFARPPRLIGAFR